MRIITTSGALLLVLSITSLGMEAGLCRSDYDEGLSAYRTKDFKAAAARFKSAADAGDRRPIVRLYLGHSLYAGGDIEAAVSAYRELIKSSPGSREAEAAEKHLAGLGQFDRSKTARTGDSPAAREEKPKELKDRITVVAPRFGHPSVSRNTVNVVRKTIEELPVHIYRILDQAGARVFVATNPLDQFPDILDLRHPADGHLVCNEPGRTYESKMFVYERALEEPGSRHVGGIRTDSDIRLATRMQCAHALDYCLEGASKDPGFRRMFKQDVEAMNPDLAEDLKLYTHAGDAGPMETFGEVALLLMGASTPNGPKIREAFPRTRMWVDAMLKKTAPKRF
ncbi:MAG: tetratricopeptide repeat protein [Candidatus Melainabacteria bacterium]|nr:tetratricopeptide repeat protein [Candidatus Melainabacteria bacterium]